MSDTFPLPPNPHGITATDLSPAEMVAILSEDRKLNAFCDTARPGIFTAHKETHSLLILKCLDGFFMAKVDGGTRNQRTHMLRFVVMKVAESMPGGELFIPKAGQN